MAQPAKVSTCIWLETGGLEAVRFWTSLFEGSEIRDEAKFDHLLTGESDAVLVIDFTLAGTPFQVLQAGPYQEHTDMMSISVLTEDQAETDRLWDALISGGGRASQCGWLKDRWGVAWQIVPRRFTELGASGDKARVGAMMAAMLTMEKLDIAALEAAYEADA